MDFFFIDLIKKIIEMYQDYLTIVSKEINAHVSRLRKVYEKFRKYIVSLNPKKFGIDKGKLLGYVVFEDGIYVDLERIKSINKIPPPNSTKYFQSFFGKINFIGRFIPNFFKRLNQ